MDAWKSSQRKQSQLLSKDAFPRILKQLCDEVCPFHETNDNLKSGFKKCGIYPLNAQPVIARLPGGLTGSQTTEESASAVSSAIINMLHSMISPPESNRRQKKRIDVAPGKGISTSDLHDYVGSNVGNGNAKWHDQTNVFKRSSDCESTANPLTGPQPASLKPWEVIQQVHIDQDIPGPSGRFTRRKRNNSRRNVSSKRVRKSRHTAVAAAAFRATRSSNSDSDDICITYDDSSDTAPDFLGEESSNEEL